MKWKFLYCRITVQRSRMIASRQVHFFSMSAFFARLFFSFLQQHRAGRIKGRWHLMLSLSYYARAHISLLFPHSIFSAQPHSSGAEERPITMMIELEACRKRTLLGRKRETSNWKRTTNATTTFLAVRDHIIHGIMLGIVCCTRARARRRQERDWK